MIENSLASNVEWHLSEKSVKISIAVPSVAIIKYPVLGNLFIKYFAHWEAEDPIVCVWGAHLFGL